MECSGNPHRQVSVIHIDRSDSFRQGQRPTGDDDADEEIHGEPELQIRKCTFFREVLHCKGVLAPRSTSHSDIRVTATRIADERKWIDGALETITKICGR